MQVFWTEHGQATGRCVVRTESLSFRITDINLQALQITQADNYGAITGYGGMPG